jgi:cytochrome P450
VPALPRWTGASWLKLTIDGKEVLIHPNTDVILNFSALHTHPDYWGPDALAFRPDRWIVDGKQGQAVHESHKIDKDRPYDWQSSSLFQPAPGTFVPWNGGPRLCPGKKFSQVEFVRVMAGLFGGGGRVRLVQEKGESSEDACKRAMKAVDEARVDFALKIRESGELGLQWYQSV